MQLLHSENCRTCIQHSAACHRTHISFAHIALFPDLASTTHNTSTATITEQPLMLIINHAYQPFVLRLRPPAAAGAGSTAAAWKRVPRLGPAPPVAACALTCTAAAAASTSSSEAAASAAAATAFFAPAPRVPRVPPAAAALLPPARVAWPPAAAASCSSASPAAAAAAAALPAGRPLRATLGSSCACGCFAPVATCCGMFHCRWGVSLNGLGRVMLVV
jgi:hypothetical protein